MIKNVLVLDTETFLFFTKKEIHFFREMGFMIEELDLRNLLVIWID